MFNSSNAGEILTKSFSFHFSNISADHMLYSEKDLEKSMDKIETIHFHEEKDVGGVKFWCYNAGHVLGAAMFMIEIAGVKVIFFIFLSFLKKWILKGLGKVSLGP